MKKPKPYDQAFKYLAEQDPRALLVMLGILKPGQKVRIKLLPNEVTVSAKLPDSTYLVTLESGAARQALQSRRQDVLSFVPLMKGGVAEVAATATRIEQIADPKKKEELGVYFSLLSGLRYTPVELLEIFGRANMITYEHIKDSSMLRYWAKEARKEGRLKGREEGRKEGRKEGREEGAAEVAAKLLTIAVQQRFPSLEASAQIEQIRDAETLQSLFVELIGTKSARAFSQRLNEVAAQQKTPSRKAKKNGTGKK